MRIKTESDVTALWYCDVFVFFFIGECVKSLLLTDKAESSVKLTEDFQKDKKKKRYSSSLYPKKPVKKL